MFDFVSKFLIKRIAPALILAYLVVAIVLAIVIMPFFGSLTKQEIIGLMVLCAFGIFLLDTYLRFCLGPDPVPHTEDKESQEGKEP